MNLRHKKVLVTGGTGFVGAHLIEKLLSSGAKVVSTYIDQQPNSYFNSQNFSQQVTHVPLDVCNFDQLHDLITRFEVDFIFHLAAQALVEVAYHNPKRTIEVNVMGTTNLLESARLYGKVKGIIVASSDKAYGKLKISKYKESHPLAGDHPYEVSKSAADLIAQSYYKTYGLPVITTRFGNIYGQGDLNYSRIVPGIMEAIIKKRILKLRSDGNHQRDYLHVKDVTQGYLLLAKHIKEIKGQAFNFGSNQTLSVLELIKLTEEVLTKQIRYKILNTAKNEIPYQHLNYQKVKALGWKPQIKLRDGLKQAYQWYEQNY